MFNDVLGKIKRLMYIANELDSGEIKVSAIADYLGVSVRTIQRDIQTLESGGFAISPLTRGTYSFVDGFSLKKLKITCEEFAMLAIFSDIANALGEKFSDTYSSLKNKVLDYNNVKESPFFVKMLKGRDYKDTEITRNIETAIENKTGARGLRNTLSNVLNKILFDASIDKRTDYTLTTKIFCY